MSKFRLIVVLLAITSIGFVAANRNRNRTGYRGRLSSGLVGRQSTRIPLTIGVGNDPLANLVNQGIGIRSVGNAQPAYHRIAILAKAANNDYLCFFDARSTASDASGYAILVIRSTDRGATWSTPTTVYTHSTFSSLADWIVSGSVVVDEITNPGNIFFFYTQATGAAGTATAHKVFVAKSTNHGASWAAPVEITSNVHVTDATHPPNHGFPSTLWTWDTPTCTAGIQIKNGSHRGRMIVPFDHRITDFSTASVSKSHVIKSDDAGTTWGLYDTVADGGRGGLDQSNASNDGSNECAITETSTPDRLVMHIRNVATGTPRYQSISTDCGANWSVMTALTNLECGVGSGTSSDVKQCGPLTVAAYSGDILHAQRSTLFFAYSTDGGATWPASTARILAAGNYAGYCSMLVDGDNILVAYESGYGNVGSSPATNLPVYSHSLKLLRANRQYLLSPTPRYSQWFFNEEANGVTVSTVGANIIDYGNLGVNATAGTAANPPTYTADGIALSSATADKIILAQADDTVFDFKPGDSFAVEVEATLTASTNGVLAGKLSGNNGWQFEVNGGKLKGIIGDGTQLPITGDTTVNGGGTRAVYGFVRNTVADTIQVYVNGVADRAAGAVTDTTTGNIATGSVACIVGDNNAGTLPLGGTIHSVRITRGVPSTLLAGTQTKKTQPEFRHYTPGNLAFPTLTIGTPALWVCRTDDLGVNSYGDLYNSERFPIPLRDGDGIRSVVESSSNRRRLYNSEFRRLIYSTDAKMGPCFDMDYVANSASLTNPALTGATLGYDFVQNTCTFTFCCGINFKATTGSGQAIIDTCNETSSNPGFVFHRDNSTGKLTVFVSRGGGTTKINQTGGGSSIVLATGTTYFLAIVGRGDSTAYDIYIAPITANYNAASPTPPTITKYTGSAANNPGAGPFNSTQQLRIGGSSGDSFHLNAYIKQVMLFTGAATDGGATTGNALTSPTCDIQLLGNFCVGG